MKRKQGENVVESRIIAHIDLDCFYVQVERSHNAALMNKPVGVVQYNPFGDLKSYGVEDSRIVNSGSLIAVSYEARAKGVKRSMRGGEAKKVCPEMILVQVPTSHGKADLTIYRDASARILTVLASKFTSCIVERASIDEVYLDVSVEAAKWLEQADSTTFLASAIDTLLAAPSMIAGDDLVEVTMSRREISKGHSGTEMLANSYTTAAAADINKGSNADSGETQRIAISSWFARPAHMWSTEDKLLLCGALVVNELRKAVYAELGFTCSAGVSNNKILAKLSSAMHKPNKQTLAPACVIPTLMKDLPYSRIQGLGGKLGTAIETIYGEKVRTMGQILAVPRSELGSHFGEETAQWLHQVSRGVDHEPVVDRALPISIGCSKSFRSSNMLTPQHIADGTVLHWLTELAGELQERLAADTKVNSRVARNLHAGASVKIFVTNDTSASSGGGEKMNNNSLSHNPDAGGGWEEWHEGRGFSLSKICPLVVSSSAATMARTSLQMLTRAINEHPKFIAAMSGPGAAGSYSGGGGGINSCSNSINASTVVGNDDTSSSPIKASDANTCTSTSTISHAVPSALTRKTPASPANGRPSAATAVSPTTSNGKRATTAAAPSLLWAITGLSMGATNFQTIEVGASSIKSYFKLPAVSGAESTVAPSCVTSLAEASDTTEKSSRTDSDVKVPAPSTRPHQDSVPVAISKEKTKSVNMFAKQRELASSVPSVTPTAAAAEVAGSRKRPLDDPAGAPTAGGGAGGGASAGTVDGIEKKQPRYSIRDAFKPRAEALRSEADQALPQSPETGSLAVNVVGVSGATAIIATTAESGSSSSSIIHWVARCGEVEVQTAGSKPHRSKSLSIQEVASQSQQQQQQQQEGSADSQAPRQGLTYKEVILLDDDSADDDVEGCGVSAGADGVDAGNECECDLYTDVEVNDSGSHRPNVSDNSTRPMHPQPSSFLSSSIAISSRTTSSSSGSGGGGGGNGGSGGDRRAHAPQSMQDVDSAVFLTLPPDVQREIELTMRLRQQTSTNRAQFNQIHKSATTTIAAGNNEHTTGSLTTGGRERSVPAHRPPESMQEVDSAVFLSLPPGIRREIELTMRLRQQRRAIDSSMFLNDEKSSIGICKR